MGWQCPPAYGKDDKRIDKKIAKLDRKIEKLNEERAVYIEAREKESKTPEVVKG